ncbi:MAG: hypothetical protein IPL97_10050 [Niastella sp.]|nr:hypothetical protein [Niastella sp.]
MKKLVLILSVSIILQMGCKNKPSNSIAEHPVDTSLIGDLHRSNDGANSALGGAYNEQAAEEEKEKNIKMQIDSAYRVIGELENVKKLLNQSGDAELSTTERNAKSKMIYSINLLQNKISRTMDERIIGELKSNCNKLSMLNDEIDANNTKLTNVSAALTEVTRSVTRLSNIFSFCLSRGWIKPEIQKTAAK